MSKNKEAMRKITEDDPEFNRNAWLHDYPAVEHEAEVTVLEVSKWNLDGRLNYTILIKDKLNLEKPVALDIELQKDGSVGCNKYAIEDVEADLDITVE